MSLFRLIAALFFILGAIFAIVGEVEIDLMFWLFGGLAAWVLVGAGVDRNVG